MRTAKVLFQGSSQSSEFQKLVAAPSFEVACHAALATLVESLPVGVADPSKSWDAYLQIIGARRVLEILSHLHEPDEPSKPTEWPTLNYETKKPKR